MNWRHWSSGSLASPAAVRPWDTPITQAGEELALQKGQHIASTMIEKFPHYKNVAKVYCSPFLRCVQTLSIMIPSLPRGPEPLNICVEPSVCEFMAAEWWAKRLVIFSVDSVRLGMHRGAFRTRTAHGVSPKPTSPRLLSHPQRRMCKCKGNCKLRILKCSAAIARGGLASCRKHHAAAACPAAPFVRRLLH